MPVHVCRFSDATGAAEASMLTHDTKKTSSNIMPGGVDRSVPGFALPPEWPLIFLGEDASETGTCDYNCLAPYLLHNETNHSSSPEAALIYVLCSSADEPPPCTPTNCSSSCRRIFTAPKPALFSEISATPHTSAFYDNRSLGPFSLPWGIIVRLLLIGDRLCGPPQFGVGAERFDRLTRILVLTMRTACCQLLMFPPGSQERQKEMPRFCSMEMTG